MTLQDAISFAQEMMMETEGSVGGLVPRAWALLMRTAVNEVAQVGDAFYASYDTDLVAGQQIYCAPPLYKILGAKVLDGRGNLVPLGFASAGDVQRYALPAGGLAGGMPRVFVAEGANRVLLYPVPTVSTVGVPAAGAVPASGYGLVVDGYAKPGDLWIPNPANASASLTVECPLSSENAQTAMLYRAMVLRCDQVQTPENQARRAGFEATHRYKKGMYESECGSRTPADRSNRNAQGDGIIGWGFDPLGRW